MFETLPPYNLKMKLEPRMDIRPLLPERQGLEIIFYWSRSFRKWRTKRQ